MILRKPYAFLIKYFKIIHIIMFFIFSYFIFAFRKIYIFFANYVKTGNFTYTSDITRIYVSPILFVFAIVIAISTILIFLLMRKKQKPVLFYRILIVYITFLLVSLVFYTSFFSSLYNTSYSPLNIVIYRDIIAFLYYVNYIFVIFTFIRGFGFDIKKFSFDRDKKELNLNEEDSEEFEVGIKIDKDSIVSYLNREKREWKYYIKENALILSIIGIILLVLIAVYLYNYFFITNKVYNQIDDIVDKNVKYHVNNVYLTRYDKYGSVVSNRYSYIVVNINIHNLEKVTLDKENFRIQVGDNFYYPSYNLYDLFDDLGEGYINKTLKENTNKNYILIFKLDKVSIDNEIIYLEILKNSSNGVYTYNKILLEEMNVNQNVTTLKKGDEISINNYKLSIEDYEFVDKVKYEYEEYVGDKKYLFIKNVNPDLNDILLSLKIKNDKELPEEIVNNYFGLICDKRKYLKDDMKFIDNNKDYYYFSVPRSINNCKEIIVKIGTRENEYDIIMREAINE